MPMVNEGMTLGDLKAAVEAMDADDSLKIKFAHYEGNMGVYSIRKFTETNEEGEISDAYIVLNA